MSNDLEAKKITFADTDEEAIDNFRKYAKKDPLPNIPPALLNSADISDYVAITGMIFPFHPEPKKGKLKTASYEVDLLGKIIYWDEHGTKITEDLTKGKSFKLISNSIAFVTPEPTFRIPDYIAVRFNLKIVNVHRGILLGTGPLVDPGYEGKLLIPLHNLTANDYIFTGGEGFIWMEFTKLSPSKRWGNEIEEFQRTENYIEFPQNRKDLDPETLIAKALKNQKINTIQSSIPPIIEKISKDAKTAQLGAEQSKIEAQAAKDIAEQIQKRTIRYSLIAIAALIVALAGIVATVYIGNRQFISIGIQNRSQIEELKQEVRNLNKNIGELQNNLTKTESKLKADPKILQNQKRN